MSDPACPMIQNQIQQIMGNLPTQQLAVDNANAQQITAQANWFTAQATLNQAQFMLNAANDQKLLADQTLMQSQAQLQMLQYMFTTLGCGT